MRKAFFQLHLAVFLAGFTGILGKLITLGEGWLVGWRMLITAVSLGLLFLPGHRLQRLPPRLVASLLGIGGIVALHWLFFYGSIKYANTSVALTCFSATGFFTAFAEPLLTRQRIQWGDVWLGAMTILGIYIIFDFHPQYKTGILLGLAAALGSALFPVFNKQLVGKVQPRTLTFYEMCGGVLLLALLLPFYGQSFVWPSASDWGWLLVLSWVCTILCFELQLKALRHISAFTANLSYNLEPLYGILLAFALFGEGRQLNGGFYVGLALIVGAVVLQTKKLVKDEVG